MPFESSGLVNIFMTQFQDRYEEILASEGMLSKTLGAAGLAGALALGGMQANKAHHDSTHKPNAKPIVKTVSAKPVQAAPTPTKQVFKTAEPTTSAADVIKKYENSKFNPAGGYDASKGKWYPASSLEGGSDTIAYGHKMLPGEDFSNGLTDTEAISLLNRDISKKEHLAANKIPNFKNFPPYVKTAIINAMFRGDIGLKTIGLINAGQWNKVPSEYLNHTNYTSGNLEGVKKRMKANADAFEKYAREHK